MRKLFALMVAIVFSAGAAIAQSNENVSTARSTVVISKDALQSVTKDFSKEEMEAIKQRAAKAKRPSNLQTEAQRNARIEEQGKIVPASSRIKADEK